jgi:hypothetical protein
MRRVVIAAVLVVTIGFGLLCWRAGKSPLQPTWLKDIFFRPDPYLGTRNPSPPGWSPEKSNSLTRKVGALPFGKNAPVL